MRDGVDSRGCGGELDSPEAFAHGGALMDEEPAMSTKVSGSG